MAITNAQQYQQLVNPPMKGNKRPGYKGREDRDSQYGGGSYDSSSNRSGRTSSTSGAGGGGNRPDPGFQNALRQQKIEQKKKEAQDLGFRDTGSVKYSPPSFFQNLKNKSFQSSINRNKVQSLRKMNLLDKGLPGFFGKVISGVTGKVPDWAKDMTEEELNEVAADIQGIKDYNQATYNPNLNPDLKGSGSELLGRTFDAQDILDTGQMTQTDYEELFPGPTLPTEGEGIQDPCKGPNPPAYCFVGIRSASAATPEVEEDEIVNYRLMADGGRAAFAGGSDMGSVADSQGNVGPGAGGYQGGGTGAVDDRSNAGQTAVNNAAIMMAQMQNQNLDKSPNLINKFPSGRVIDKINLDKMIANMNLNTVTEEDDEEEAVIGGGMLVDTIRNAPELKNRIGAIGAAITSADLGLANGGRAGLAEGGMPYEGGIMDLESSRQMYGLGKLVKKITRGVKKVAKSPIGKAALGAALFKFGGGFAADGFFKKTLLPKLYTEGAMTGLGKGLLYAGVPAALSYLMTPKEEDEDETLYAGADIDDPRFIMANPSKYTNPRLMAEGGSTEEPVAKKTMPLLDMDGKEMDLRAEGGFVPIGRMEKADDVPARLSKNEFVFTADAVRNAGEGDVDKGAEVMYNMMKNLESGGEVSEESQGLEGARDMFQTSQRLEEVI